MTSFWKRRAMSRGGVLSIIVATALFLLSGKPAAAMYLDYTLTLDGYNLYGYGNVVCACKTSACNQPGDFCYTCSYLTGATFGVDPTDVSYCSTACNCVLTRYGLLNWACCYNKGLQLLRDLFRRDLFRQEAQPRTT